MATYVIKKGDTLYSIAKSHGTTVDALEAANPGIRPTHLRIGQVINLTTPVVVPPVTPPPVVGTYLFEDEFDGPAGSAPDSSKWVYDLGGGGWGNDELETYTNNTKNCFQDGNSNLVIRALKDSSGNYTSARLKTQGKFSHYGGTWEARLKLPFVAGTWPAWWCMGVNPAQWPASGEVDIVEAYGSNPFMETSVHILDSAGDGMQPMTGQKGIRYQDNTIGTEWHTYRMAWDTVNNLFTFSIDGTVYLTVTGAGKTGWPYHNNNPFYMLLNLAVGGAGGGSPSGLSSVDLLCDYVRVTA